MILFAFVAAIWSGVGYVYADHDKATAAIKFGVTVIAVGWLAIWGAVAVKFVKIWSRRRESAAITDDADSPNTSAPNVGEDD